MTFNKTAREAAVERAEKIQTPQPPTVEDVRKDLKVGRGTCSVIEECYTDEELQEEINETYARGENVIEFLRSIEDMYNESAL